MKHLYAVILALTFFVCAVPANAADALASLEGDMPKELQTLIERVLGEAEDAPRSMAQARRRGIRAKDSAITVLRSQGYYGAQVDVKIPRLDDNDTQTREPQKPVSRRPVLVIKTGPQFEYGEIDVAYEEASSEDSAAQDTKPKNGKPINITPEIAVKIKSELPIKSGAPARAAQVVSVEASIVNALRQEGYPDAAALTRRAVVDHAQNKLSVTYRIAPGKKTRYGDIILTGDANISKRWVAKISPTRPEALASTAELNILSSRIISTQAFAGARTTLAGTPRVNPDGTVTRDIIVDVEAGKKNTISAQVGVSTTDGSGIDAVYTRRNLGQKGQTFKASASAKTNLISLGADYSIPYAGRVERALDLGAQIAREDTEAFEGERVTSSALVTQKFNEHLRVSAGLGFEASRFNEGGTDTRALLIDGLGRVSYDARNSILDPTDGFNFEASATPTYNFGQEDGVFANIETSASTYKRLSDTLVFASRAKLGTILGSSLDRIPLNRRFYGGGGGSVRGFGFQSVSPVDAEGTFTGGRSLAEASAEIRYHGKSPFGFAAFIDAGSVNASTLPDFRDTRFGAGAGIRYHTSFAPIRADIAIPLNKRDGDDSFQVYISIGQAF